MNYEKSKFRKQPEHAEKEKHLFFTEHSVFLKNNCYFYELKN
jgi:hypothetical protein